MSGPAAISPLREWLKKRLPREDFTVSNQAHALEHSIEALVPFLQYANPDIKITPIMVTAMPFERMEELSGRLAAALAAYIRENKLQLGRDIVFLISADANHYGRDFDNIPFGEDEKAHEQGIGPGQAHRRLAWSTARWTTKRSGLTRELWGASYLDYRNTYWCGKYDIPFGLLAIRKTVRAVDGAEPEGEAPPLLRHLQRGGPAPEAGGVRHHRPVLAEALGRVLLRPGFTWNEPDPASIDPPGPGELFGPLFRSLNKEQQP